MILLILFVSSCGPKPRPVQFPVKGTDRLLYGLSHEAAIGRLEFTKAKKLEYRFAGTVALSPPASLEIEYSLETSPSLEAALSTESGVVFEAGNHTWVLPRWADLGAHGSGGIIHYAVPIGDSFPDDFSITLAGGANAVHIRSLNFIGRRYGFERFLQASTDHIYASPFISRQDSGSAWVLDPPAVFRVPADYFPALSSTLRQGKEAALAAGNRRFEASPYLEHFNVPAGIIAPNEYPLSLSGDRIIGFRLGYVKIPPFPAPLTADPGMVLAWPQDAWRGRRYEVFRWENFPSLLIFDTADYAVQDRLLKRLAFFVEKAGFRGRLAPDDEIAELHGWNAHDYRAEDLALFFQTARETNFPLLAEERELEKILLSAEIIKESGAGIRGGEGGIISISRESEDYLRFRFMAHEGFHGLFFIDEDFRAFSRQRWQQLPAEARRFIVSYFDYQRYDTADEYLLINEFMAHILQQPVSQAGYYFGQALPSRIEENSWRKASLPEKDSGTWPVLAEAFTREASAFSAYVGNRWGLAAGRIHLVTVRQL
ncbi:MAG: hypothetical protein LBG95_00485 [Treponema sp.]|nr:hypothetical protein [Treponema sp.]